MNDFRVSDDSAAARALKSLDDCARRHVVVEALARRHFIAFSALAYRHVAGRRLVDGHGVVSGREGFLDFGHACAVRKGRLHAGTPLLGDEMAGHAASSKTGKYRMLP